MQVINFYGGPGSGKSTMAAAVFTKLKWFGYNVELVPEFAKDLVWEKRSKTLDDQIYIFGKQNHRLHRLIGQVDFAITDSPLLNSIYYCQEDRPSFKSLVLDVYRSYQNIDIFVERCKVYNPSGRLQTEAGARLIDQGTRDLLDRYGIPCWSVSGKEESVEPLTLAICNMFGKKQEEDL
jgi:hypothetical protein